MVRVKSTAPRLRATDQRTAKPAPSTGPKQLYGTSAWIKLIARLRRDRGDNCERCGKKNCRVVGDHIIELRDGGDELDERNVQLVCIPCHTTKTNVERAKRLSSPL